MTDPTINVPAQQSTRKQVQYSLVRQILFPFNGEEPLSLREGLRVILGWIAFFLPGIIIITLFASFESNVSLQRMLTLLAVAVLLGIVLFGVMGLITVSISNRAARFFQAYRATKAEAARGGKHGS